MSKALLENEIRSRLFEIILKALNDAGEFPMAISTSEYTCPVVDSKGEEAFANIKITIPRGSRKGDGTMEPYDGYVMHDDWMATVAEREDAKKAREEKKARAEAERERKREAKKVVKKMKEEMDEILPSQAE